MNYRFSVHLLYFGSSEPIFSIGFIVQYDLFASQGERLQTLFAHVYVQEDLESVRNTDLYLSCCCFFQNKYLKRNVIKTHMF